MIQKPEKPCYMMVAAKPEKAPYIVRGSVEGVSLLKALCGRLGYSYVDLDEDKACAALKAGTLDGVGVGCYLSDDLNVVIDNERFELANVKAIDMTKEIGFSILSYPVGI